jgi:hypothetical protein
MHETNNNSIDPGRDAMLASLIDLNPNPDSDSKPVDKSKNESETDPETHSMFELEIRMILETHTKTKSRNKFALQSKNLGSILRGFKSAVTKFAIDNNITFNCNTPLNFKRRFYHNPTVL